MTALVVTLWLAVPTVSGPWARDGLLDDRVGARSTDDPQDARIERDRCIGAGAAGAIGVALGFAVGGGVAFGIGELVKAADPANTSAGRNFDAFAIPLGALAGAVAGAAVGTIGAYDLGGQLAGKPSVMR